MARPTPGIRERHGRSCPTHNGGTCRKPCTPSYEAWAYDRRSGRKLRRTFTGRGALAAAKSWRASATSQLAAGALQPPTKMTVREAADELVAGMRDGSVRNRKGEVYKPSATRSYAQALEDYVVPDLGAHRLSEVTRGDVQRLVDRLLARGLDPSTVRGAILPLRVILRRALRRGAVATNVTLDLEMPAAKGRRDRVARPEEAEKLLAALPELDRALWASAMFTGLRLGELRALRLLDVDLDRNEIHVRRSWDQAAGEIAPKSESGTRLVPIPAVLRSHLAGQALRQGRPADGLVFGTASGKPFNPSTIYDRAYSVWDAAGLRRIALHECRHTFVTLMFGAGVPLETIGDLVGHAGAYMTERYRHLLEGTQHTAAARFDDYFQRATGARPGAQPPTAAAEPRK